MNEYDWPISGSHIPTKKKFGLQASDFILRTSYLILHTS
jgi:hypothetical protein